MRFREGKGRWKEMKIFWRGEEIEEVKEFSYLGYKMRRNNGEQADMEHLEKKAVGVLGRVWSMGERKLRKSFSGRIKLFDTSVASMITYGAEIRGWKRRKGLEKIQERYLKWCLKLNRTTPMHIVMLETEREKIEVKAATRAMKL